MPLGILANAPLSTPDPFQFETGDFLAVMSDGFFEYANTSGELFGEERVMAYLKANQAAPAEEMISGLVEAIQEFAGDGIQDDDMTIFILKRKNKS